MRIILQLFLSFLYIFFFFFNDTATTEIYTLSLHDALPIFSASPMYSAEMVLAPSAGGWNETDRSEEHTSELQSRQYLVCRLLLEKKKKIINQSTVGSSENPESV